MLGKTVSHYRIIEKLGSGGMGDVYVADNLHLKNRAALKFLPPHLSRDEDAKRRFIQEAQSASALNHPNVCTIYDIDEADDGQLFMAMALYEGQTLKDRLEDGALPVDEAIGIARQVAEGLAAAHEQGIVHRDIKPANIFITKKGRAVILDFGLAKLQESTAILTASGSTLGTAAYMSPEQARGEAVDHRSDIWSLGVVLYEMLAGERPFKAEYQQALVYQILNEPAPALRAIIPGVPDEAAALLESMLAKEPEARPDSAEQIASALAGSTIATLHPTRPKRGWGYYSVVGTLITVAAILIGLSVGGVLRSTKPTDVVVERSGIAVLPFTVAGSNELAYLSEGMVDLLSTKLDGLPGMRSIDPNALFSRLAQDSLGKRMTVEEGKYIAGKFVAEGFILGSVIRVGGPIQVKASLYDAVGELVSEVSEMIASDTLVLGAIDRLAMGLLSVRLEGGGEETQSLAAVTTNSYDALRSYLKGEEAMRRRDADAAYDAFSLAVEQDSAFALAWYRLSNAAGWSQNRSVEKPRFLAAAERHVDRLPEATRLLVRAGALYNDGHYGAATVLLDEALTKQPDNAIAWLQKAEMVWHSSALEGGSPSDARSSFRRALRLIPDIGFEAKFHLFEIAVTERHYEAAESLSAEVWPALRNGLELTVAADKDVRQTLADSIGRTRGVGFTHTLLLTHFHQPQVAHLLLPYIDDEVRPIYFRNSEIMAGRIGASLADEDFRERWPDRWLFHLAQVLPYYPVDSLGLKEYREYLADIDTTTFYIDNVPVLKLFAKGLIDWRLGDRDALLKSIDALENADSVVTRGPWYSMDSTAEMNLSISFGRTLDALQSWIDGDATSALESLHAARFESKAPDHNNPLLRQATTRFFLGEVLRSEGHYEEALRWYRSVWGGDWNRATIRLAAPSIFGFATCQYNLGNNEEAIHYYTRFIDLWQDADERLQPWVAEARESLDRLLEEQAKEPS